MAKRKYYVERMPRGFSNEIETYSFPSQEMRRKYIEDHDRDKPTDPHRISAREARKNINYRGDALTQSYNSSERRFEIYSAKSRNDCEFNGGEWVESYRKKDGTRVTSYCRIYRD